jgi:hypothetical protein
MVPYRAGISHNDGRGPHNGWMIRARFRRWPSRAGGAERRPGRRRRIWYANVIGLAAVAATAVVLISLSGRSPGGPTLPRTFGEYGQCYYVRSPSEAAELKKAGDCPEFSTSARMPASWLIAYFPFYNSRYYTGTFVASHDQSSFRAYMDSFDARHSGKIGRDAPFATYIDGKGDEIIGRFAGVNSSDTGISTDDSTRWLPQPGQSRQR